jgi:hypothetical protein
MSLYDLRAASVVARNTGSASPRHAAASLGNALKLEPVYYSAPVPRDHGRNYGLDQAVTLRHC